MTLQNYYQPVFDAIPDSLPDNPTFMEIAGFPHYENVCSNFLKYYLTPNDSLGGLNGVLLTAILKSVNKFSAPFDKLQALVVKRESPTNTGRIDLLLYNNAFVIAIENKIYHWLDNDLIEYAAFIANKFGERPALKIVLSLKKEIISDNSGFINLTYSDLFSAVQSELNFLKFIPSEPYFLIFSQFIQTIKKLDMPIQMSDEEILFFSSNQDKITQIVDLNSKLTNYINQRVNKLCRELEVPHLTKSVYDGDEILMYYEHADWKYKIECVLDPGGIYITICMLDGSINYKALQHLRFFIENPVESFRINPTGDRMIIEDKINFWISDNALKQKLQSLLLLFKFSEPTNEQLN